MLVFSIFIFLGMFADLLAILSLELHLSMMTIILLHFTAVTVTLAAFYHIKYYYQHFRHLILILLFLLALLLPLLGILACVFIARMFYLTQQRYKRVAVQQLKLDDKITPFRNRYGVGGLHHVIKTDDAPVSTRIAAFKSLSNIAPEKINALVRSMLPDKQEELRLLAFYLLNKQETKMVNEISQTLALLAKTSSSSLQAKLHKWLANQYWELIYKQLVDPHLIDHVANQSLYHATLAQSFHHATLAQKILPDDPSLLFLLGKIYYRQQEIDKAVELFQQAIKLGGLLDRISPYIAQAYFSKRQFAELKKYTQSSSSIYITQVSRNLIDFWGRKNG